MPPLFYSDVHCHSSMKPFHSGEQGKQKSLWFDFEKSDKCNDGLLDKFVENMIKYSQADFHETSDSNMLLVLNSLYPIELSWFAMTRIGKIIVNKENRLRLAGCLTNFDEHILLSKFLNVKDEIPDPADPDSLRINYFSRLTNEYDYVRTQEQDTVNNFRILKDFNDYRDWKSMLTANPPLKQMAVILCIEGSHSFTDFDSYSSMLGYTYEKVKDDQWDDFAIFRDKLIERIDQVKNWGPDPGHPGAYAPLYITFSHHFWNMMAGHCQSLNNCFLDQAEGQDQPITPLGKIAVEKFLEKGKTGRRILLDVKHMSFLARNYYYDVIRQHVRNGDPVPIIASHTAVTGTFSPDGTHDEVFNTCDINLYDWDIQKIVTSEGLIGIMMEEARLLRPEMLDRINKLYQDNPNGYEEILAEVVMAQILHIADVCPGTSGWDCVCLGTDFDGMINSLDEFDTARKIPALCGRIGRILASNTDVLTLDFNWDDTAPPDIRPVYTAAEVKKLMGGMTADEIVEKISYKNVERLLEKYFHDGYLKLPAAGPRIAGNG